MELVSRLLEYTPSLRQSPIDACAHHYFDELRDPSTRLPTGRDLPPLFNFTAAGTLSPHTHTRAMLRVEPCYVWEPRLGKLEGHFLRRKLAWKRKNFGGHQIWKNKYECTTDPERVCATAVTAGCYNSCMHFCLTLYSQCMLCLLYTSDAADE